MAKRALLIGCNYPGTKAELHGCVNDVSRMYKSLVEQFGFNESNITVMVDTDKRSVQPTGVNIKKVLGRLIDQSVPGDILVMHYSGHGTQVPAETGDPDDDGLDEAIVPTDLNILTDDDFRLVFQNIKRGVAFTFISDSCHSGGLIDHEKEQIGPDTGDTGATRGFQAPVPSQSRVATRGYDGGYGRESGEYLSGGERHGHHEYGGREEPEYEREERYGQHGRREQPEYQSEERYGQHGRREQPEYQSEERYGQHGRREQPEYRSEERYGQHGRREQPVYESEERYGHHGRREESEEPRRERYSQQEYGQRPERREEGGGYGRRVNSVNKSLSIETLTEMLSQQAGHQVKPGNIRTSLYDLFGEDASPTVKVFVNLIAGRLGGAGSSAQDGGGIWGTIGGLAMDFLKTKLNDSGSGFSVPTPVASSAVSQSGYAGKKPPPSQRVPDDVGVLVSGCQSNETSADANPTGNPAQAYGALSNGIQTILAENPGPISNGDLVRSVRALLKKQGFSQHPCLYSSDGNVNAPFICRRQ